MLQWILGEKRYISIIVSEAYGEDFSITSATYTVFDVESEEVVVSGVATVDDHACYTLWQPDEVGVYIAQFDYIIGLVQGSSRQVFEVRETM